MTTKKKTKKKSKEDFLKHELKPGPGGAEKHGDYKPIHFREKQEIAERFGDLRLKVAQDSGELVPRALLLRAALRKGLIELEKGKLTATKLNRFLELA